MFVATMWQTGTARWEHRACPSRSDVEELRATGWEIARILSLKDESAYRPDAANDLDLLGFRPLRGADATRIKHLANVGADAPLRWKRLKSACSLTGKLRACDLAGILLSDESLLAGRTLPNAGVVARRFVKYQPHAAEPPRILQWERQRDEMLPEQMIFGGVTSFLSAWPALVSCLRYLHAHPQHAIRLMYGWQPSRIEFLADGEDTIGWYIDLAEVVLVGELFRVAIACDQAKHLVKSVSHDQDEAGQFVVTLKANQPQ